MYITKAHGPQGAPAGEKANMAWVYNTRYAGTQMSSTQRWMGPGGMPSLMTWGQLTTLNTDSQVCDQHVLVWITWWLENNSHLRILKSGMWQICVGLNNLMTWGQLTTVNTDSQVCDNLCVYTETMLMTRRHLITFNKQRQMKVIQPWLWVTQ